MKLTIVEYDGMNNTPVIPLMAAMWVEVLDRGYINRETIGSWDNKVLAAFELDKGEYSSPIGFLAYEHIKWRKSVWISMAYVQPDYRAKGVYTKLFNKLKSHAFSLDPRPVIIEGGISPHNATMCRAAESQDRRITTMIYTYDIKGSDSEEIED